jgi:hypothetical protein
MMTTINAKAPRSEREAWRSRRKFHYAEEPYGKTGTVERAF